MEPAPPSPEVRAAAAQTLDRWLAEQGTDNPIVEEVEVQRSGAGDGGVDRWYVRLVGEEKDAIAVWFALRQRTLHVETFLLPAPEDNHAEFYRNLLVRNVGFYGMAFAIGPEDGIFLVGQVEIANVTEDELDRLLGSVYTYVEKCFRPALRIGFESRLSQAEPG